MKKAITILFAAAAINTANAQEAPFDKGTNVISAGIGIGSSIGSGLTNRSQAPGFSVNYERGVWAVGGPGIISLGGYVGIKSFKNEQSYPDYYFNGVNLIPYTYTVSQKWNYTVIGVRSAYHYNGINSDKFDVYGGAMLSYNILSIKHESNDPYNNYVYNSGAYGSNVYISFYAGGRYFFSDNFGAYGELGWGVALLSLGISYKF